MEEMLVIILVIKKLSINITNPRFAYTIIYKISKTFKAYIRKPTHKYLAIVLKSLNY